MSIKRWKLGWKRCDCVKCEAALTIEQTEEDCGWVRWGDHKEEIATLKAEVQRLRASSFATAVPSEEYERSTAQYNGIIDTQLKVIDELKAEVERLRKAGDAMAEGLLKYIEPTDGYLTYLECRANWNAAKEGKQP